MPRTIDYTTNIRPILAAIRTVPVPAKPEPQPPGARPFITISREPGAGAWSLAQQLAEALEPQQEEENRWSCWDRELMEKVAADQNIHTPLMEGLEETSYSWFVDFLNSLSSTDDPTQADDAKRYTRVAGTIRALAQAGRTIIVGGGGVFITRRMPGGIHVRLVAPLDYRIDSLAHREHLSKEDAAARVRQLEKNRHSFFKRYWPAELLNPESFTITFNCARINSGTMVEMLRALVKQVEAELALQPKSAP